MESKYKAAEVTPEQREALAKVYWAARKLCHAPRDIWKIYEFAGFVISERTLRSYEDKIERNEDIFSSSKKSGRPRTLLPDELNIFIGWIIHNNQTRCKVGLQESINFILATFDKSLGRTQISALMKENGFASRSAKHTSASYELDSLALAKLLTNWNKTQRDAGHFSGVYASIDFTYSSHRTNQERTFAPSGCAQPVLAKQASRFTNSFVTCMWHGRHISTPAIMFTYNQAFRRDRNVTEKRAAALKRIDSLLRKYKIDKSRIVYVGKQSNEKRTFVGESPNLVKRFFEIHKCQRGVIFSDAGNSFFEGGASVLENLHFTHVTYPPPVHQYLSPNDNRLHGVAKNRWRNSGKAYADDIESSIELLHCLDQVSLEQHNKWMERNFSIFDSAEAVAFINGDQLERSLYFQKCLTDYRDQVLERPKRGKQHFISLPTALESNFDGEYWTTWLK
jgi:hypothetical protein